MQRAVYESQVVAPSMLFGAYSPDGFFRIDVRRSNLLTDTLNVTCMATEHDLKKPMRVQFQGEEAEDAGGVTKEFFMLLIKELLDPKYGMFQEYEETRTIWFHPGNFDDDITNYKLVGG
jgi:E3 ubiquitin-protein ligase HERC4